MVQTEFQARIVVAAAPSNIVSRGNIDLVVLRYMLQKIRVTLHSIEQPVSDERPLMYTLAVGHHHTQRIALYHLQSLLAHVPLSFVGFVSGKQKAVEPAINHELLNVDTHLTRELVHIPGLLGYSSLELRAGTWYNLVLLSNFDIKAHLKNDAMHRHAAYQLAPHYYEWIRLHSGIVPAGLPSNTLTLQRTKYYQSHEQGFTVREFTY